MEEANPDGGDNFMLEDIPTKMILVEQKTSEETHMVVYHNGKCFNDVKPYFRGFVSLAQGDYRCGKETLQGAR